MCCVSNVYRLALGLALQLLLVSPALGSAIGLASVRLRRAIHRALEEGQDDFIAYLTGGQSAGIVLYLLLLPIIIHSSCSWSSFSTRLCPRMVCDGSRTSPSSRLLTKGCTMPCRSLQQRGVDRPPTWTQVESATEVRRS